MRDNSKGVEFIVPVVVDSRRCKNYSVLACIVHKQEDKRRL